MYRKRRRSLRRRRRATAVAAFAAVFAVVVGMPTLAAANQVNDLLNNLGLGGGSGGSAGSSGGGASSAPADTRAGAPPTYTPPLHGANPHGQGTVGTVDLSPSDDVVLSGDPSQSGEEVVVGDSRGEQNSDGSYHGRVDLASVLGLTIPGLTPVETNPGESKDGPLQPLQDGLDTLCTQSGGQACLSLLEMHSSTTTTGSSNSFRAAGVSLGGAAGINAEVATSHGNISSDGTCQTSHGDSSVADASVATLLSASAIDGSSDSVACNNGSQSVSQDSSVVGLNGTGLAVPVPGCEDGTPNSNFDLLGLVGAVCNANVQDSGATSSPYGVREGLTVFLLGGVLDNSLLKVTTAGPESHAVAPAAQTPTTPPGGGGGTKGAGGNGGNNGAGNGGGAGTGGGAGPAAATAAAGNGQLAFTGADLLALGLVGGALILGGLALTTTAGRRHRQTI